MKHDVIPFHRDLWHCIRDTWQRLCRDVGERSPFLSGPWISSWVEVFGDRLRPEAHVWRTDEGDPVACVLVSHLVERVGPFRIRRAYVNATGEHAVASEHNRILATEEHRGRVTRTLVDTLLERGVEELALHGFGSEAEETIRSAWPNPRWAGYHSESPYVDLRRVRACNGDYLACLTRNTRSQIRRSIKLYRERYGEPRLDRAGDPAEARSWLSDLVRLHETRWHSLGLPGAFGTDEVARFNALVIERSFEEPDELNLDLIRVRFGEQTIGMLYNLRRGTHVGFYQSGFLYQDDNRFKPGLVSHAVAIEHYLEGDTTEYDFLAGERQAVQYKRSLSTDSRTLRWVELRAPAVRMHAIHLLRNVGRRLLGKG